MLELLQVAGVGVLYIHLNYYRLLVLYYTLELLQVTGVLVYYTLELLQVAGLGVLYT